MTKPAPQSREKMMAKVVLAMVTSLDGHIENANKQFVPPQWTDDLQKHWTDANFARTGALMFGRVCFEGMAAYWQSPEAEPKTARAMTGFPKIVFSRTMREPGWANTRIVSSDIPGEIAALKKRTDKDLILLGGADIAASFIELGLLDEYMLLLAPTVLGGGNPLFKGGHARFDLELIEARRLDTGAMLLRYEPVK
jgi:dihydrofolate reductase